jgi:hypothetical protein
VIRIINEAGVVIVENRLSLLEGNAVLADIGAVLTGIPFEPERATGTKYYFATPYHSWERGTSENFNGLVRQYAPTPFPPLLVD